MRPQDAAFQKILMPRLHLGFDDRERNLTFAKTDFQILKLKFYACNFKQAFYPHCVALTT